MEEKLSSKSLSLQLSCWRKGGGGREVRREVEVFARLTLGYSCSLNVLQAEKLFGEFYGLSVG